MFQDSGAYRSGFGMTPAALQNGIAVLSAPQACSLELCCRQFYRVADYLLPFTQFSLLPDIFLEGSYAEVRRLSVF